MSETKTFEELFLSSNLPCNLSTTSLQILVISNINSNYMYLQKLKEWQLQNQVRFDHIFFLGNFLHSELKAFEKTDFTIYQSEAEISGLLGFLEGVYLSVYYIGGKNDPISLFADKPPTLTIHTKNMHCKHMKLLDDLYLVGIGINGNESKKKIRNMFIETFQKFEKDIRENNTTKNIKVIILTNIGSAYLLNSNKPQNNSNNININNNNSNNENCCFGSEMLDEILKERKDILMNCYGDNKERTIMYYGIGNNCCCINPGELEKGKFSVIDLERNEKNDYQWEVKRIRMLSLN